MKTNRPRNLVSALLLLVALTLALLPMHRVALAGPIEDAEKAQKEAYYNEVTKVSRVIASVARRAPEAAPVTRDVTAYGAKPNDGVDDRAAIQAAINAGGEIVFPDGEYTINGQLTGASNVTLRPANPLKATLRFKTGTNQFALLLDNTSNVTITGLNLRANCGVIAAGNTKWCTIVGNDFQWGDNGTYYNRIGVRSYGNANLTIDRNNWHDSLSSDRNIDVVDCTAFSYSYNTWFKVNDGGHLDGRSHGVKVVGNRGKQQHRMFFELQDHFGDSSCGDILVDSNVGDGNINVYGESWFLSIMPQCAGNVRITNNYGRCYTPEAGTPQNDPPEHGYGLEAGFTTGEVTGNTLVSPNSGGFRAGIVCSMPNTPVKNNKLYGKTIWNQWITTEGGLGGNGSVNSVNNQTLAFEQAPPVPTDGVIVAPPDNPMVISNVRATASIDSTGKDLITVTWSATNAGSNDVVNVVRTLKDGTRDGDIVPVLASAGKYVDSRFSATQVSQRWEFSYSVGGAKGASAAQIGLQPKPADPTTQPAPSLDYDIITTQPIRGGKPSGAPTATTRKAA